MDPAAPASDPGVRRFRFDFASSYRGPALAFGVRDATAEVAVTATELVARFGPWHLRTGLDNVVATEFTGPFAYPKTVGPAHLSFSDRGLTFATTGEQGLLIHFAEPVRGIEPFGLLRHPNLTVTVLDRAGLAAALQPDPALRAVTDLA